MQFETTHLFNSPKRKKFLGMRESALFEIFLALGILMLLDYFAFDNTRYWLVNPHPFWFVILLIASKYGTAEALVAAIASSVLLLVGNMPEQTINQDNYAYLMYVLKLPLLWLISAIAFGELRQMHIRERNRLENALKNSQEREQSVAEAYQRIKTTKDQLELRLAGQLRSSIAAYHAARSMETLDPADVLKGLEELIGATLYPEQFSIFSMANKGLEITMMHGWTEQNKYQRSFSSSSPLYQEVIGKQKILCVANKDHERILQGEAVLAGPLLDRNSGEVVGMLKIERMGLSDLNLSNIEAFGTICEWAGMAMVNAGKYQTAKLDSIVNPDHNLFTYNYFKRYNEYLRLLAERVDFDVSMIDVKLANPGNFDEEMRKQLARILSDAVESVLRKVDLAFDHQEHREEYTILLPTTNREGAQIALDKLTETLQSNVRKITQNANFSFTIQTVYEKRGK